MNLSLVGIVVDGRVWCLVRVVWRALLWVEFGVRGVCQPHCA